MSDNYINSSGVSRLWRNILQKLNSYVTKNGDGATGTWDINISGNAETATKLKASRTISLKGDVTGSTSFNGETNAEITATVANDSHEHTINTITKGTTLNKAGGVSAVNSSKFDVTRACRTAFMPANAITVEYTQDGGTTWLDYEATDNEKQGLFSLNRGWQPKLGKTGTATIGYGLRITVAPIDRHTSVDGFYCWFNSAGHTSNLKIERSTIGNPTTFTTVRENLRVDGWAGPNDITFPYGTFGGGANQLSNYYAYRFTFLIVTVSASQTALPSVTDLRMYGDSAWSTPNNMMARDHIYSWDKDQNVTFPAKVTATTFNGNATSATKATQDGAGNVIVNTYATKNEVKQSDWNQTDETALDFIKNKPDIVTKDWVNEKVPEGAKSNQQLVTDNEGKSIWEDKPFGEKTITGEIFPETEAISIDEDNSTFAITTPYTNEPSINGQYIITYNGIEYECTGHFFEMDGINIIIYGNSIVFGGEDTEEPFAIGTIPIEVAEEQNLYAMVIPLDGATSVTIAMRGTFNVVTQIDSKFINLPKLNLVNGNIHGSLRTKSSRVEDSEYTMGRNAFAEGDGTTASGETSHAEGLQTTASGPSSHAEGGDTTASGIRSHAEGNNTIASGASSHAEGERTTASGDFSHAEGDRTIASNNGSHAEGSKTTASGAMSHAEGNFTIASGYSAHAEGDATTASGDESHAEGSSRLFSRNVTGEANATTYTLNSTQNLKVGDFISNKKIKILEINGKEIIVAETLSSTALSNSLQSIFRGEASGEHSHVEGTNTTASEKGSHAEGIYTIASNQASHAEGFETIASGEYSHAEGNQTIAASRGSHAEGIGTIASGGCSHAEGNGAKASGFYSHAEGTSEALGSWSHSEGDSTAVGEYSHAEGNNTIASGKSSHTEGWKTTASENYSHAEGSNTTASGEDSHAEGSNTTASGDSSHAEGIYTYAIAAGSHVEGRESRAEGFSSHAEGYSTKTTGEASHAEGRNTIASGDYSHAAGLGTKANRSNLYVFGQHNKADPDIYISTSVGENLLQHSEYPVYLISSTPTLDTATGIFTVDNMTQIPISEVQEGNLFTFSSSDIKEYYEASTVEHDLETSRSQLYVTKRFSKVDGSLTSKYLHMVGNGSAGYPSNAYTLDRRGVGWFASGLKVGGTGQDDEAAVEVATQEYVNAPKSQLILTDQVTGENYIVCMREGTLVTYKAE